MGDWDPVDDDLQAGKLYSPADRRAIAEIHGVTAGHVTQRINVLNGRRANLKNLGCLAIILAVLAYLLWPAGNSSDMPAGSTASDRERYENLSPEGQEYVRDQMKKYDEHCSRSDDC